MQKSHIRLVALVLVCCLAQFGVDIIAPSLPAMAHDFGQSINLVQWSMVIYLLSWSLSQLVYGPWADRVGRRVPMCVGVALIAAGSLLCAFSQSIAWLMLGRLIQGLGAGACSLWRSIFRDLYSGDQLAKMGSYLGTIIVFIIPAAPLLGGYFQVHLSWHASFYFMLAYALLSILLIVFVLEETGANNRQKNKALPIFKTYAEVLTHHTFLWYVLCAFLTYGAFFAWFVVGPVLWIKVMGHTASTFGEISFVISALMMLAGSLYNAKLIGLLGSRHLLLTGWGLMILSGVLFVLLFSLFGLNVFNLFFPMAILYFGATLIWPNVYSNAFASFGHIAGFATAVYAMGQNLGGFILGGLMAHCPDHTPVFMGATIIIASCIGITVYLTRIAGR